MKPYDELFTPEKVATDARLQQQPEFKYISTNRVDCAPWHIGRRKISRYSRSGLISSVHYVTACSGKQLGGAFGQMEMEYGNPPADLCERCKEWKWKNETCRGQKVTV